MKIQRLYEDRGLLNEPPTNRSIRQQSIVYLDNKMLARDLKVATKNPTGRIR